MNPLLDSLARASIEGGIAIMAAWALTRLLRSAPARVHCWLWRLALAKAFVCLAGVAKFDLPLLPPQPRNAPTQAATVEVLPSHAILDFAATVSSIEPEPPGVPGFRSALAAVWLAGVGIGCFWLLHGLARVRRLRAGSAPARSDSLPSLLAELLGKYGLPRPPEVRVTAGSEMPMLIGILRPVLLLPPWALNGPKDRLRLILAHELAHLKRRDLLWAWLPALARVAFFFHPLAWLAQREHRLAQETACDEMAMRATSAGAADYAEGLLAVVARACSPSRPDVFSAGIVESKKALKRRIHSMKHIHTNARRRLACSAAMLAIGAIAAIPFRLVAADPLSVERKAQEHPPAETVVYQNAPPASGMEAVVRAVAVSARRPGVVRKIHVRAGDEVKEGQLLVELETDEAELRLRAAEVRRRVAQAKFEAKLAELQQEENRLSPASIKQAELQRILREIEADRTRLAQLRLTYTETSPFVQECRERIARLETEQKILMSSEDDEGKEAKGISAAMKAAFQARRAEAEAEAQLAGIAIDEARLELKLHRIAAPCDGTVLKIGAFPGESVAAQGQGEPVIVIETRLQAKKR